MCQWVLCTLKVVTLEDEYYAEAAGTICVSCLLDTELCWQQMCVNGASPCDLVPCDTIYALVTLYLVTRFMHL